MINGIDVLFVVIGFVLLFVFIEGWNKYWTWSDWDRERRRQRKYFLYEFQDDLTEMSYRQYLRDLNSPGLIATMHRTTRSFEKFNKALRGETSK